MVIVNGCQLTKLIKPLVRGSTSKEPLMVRGTTGSCSSSASAKAPFLNLPDACHGVGNLDARQGPTVADRKDSYFCYGVGEFNARQVVAALKHIVCNFIYGAGDVYACELAAAVEGRVPDARDRTWYAYARKVKAFIEGMLSYTGNGVVSVVIVYAWGYLYVSRIGVS